MSEPITKYTCKKCNAVYTQDPNVCQICGSKLLNVMVTSEGSEGTAFLLERTLQENQALIQYAVEREREACALLVQELADEYEEKTDKYHIREYASCVSALDRAVTQIRARSEKEK